MDFTGERMVPGKTPPDIYKEHIDRYIFAADFVRGRTVLDVACGTGYGVDFLVGRGARSVTGADVSREAVEYARERFGGNGEARYLCANAVRLPFRDRSFEVLVSFETLEHIRAYRKFLAECRRVLAEEGLLICSTPNRRVFSPDLPKPLNPFHFKEFWPAEFRKLLGAFFKDIRFFGQCDVDLSDYSVERRYGVRDFSDNERTSSAYIIAVGQRKS